MPAHIPAPTARNSRPPQEGTPHLAATSKIVDLIEPVTPKPLLQRGRYVDPAGEDNDPGRRDRRPWLSFRQELDPPGDSIPAVHEVQARRRGEIGRASCRESVWRSV